MPPDTPDAKNLPTHIDSGVQAVADLHAEHRERATRHQRIIERATGAAGRPVVQAAVAAGAAAWMALNLELAAGGRAPLDAPPFFWLQGVATLTALTVTTLVLTAQRRDDELASRRDQLNLELAILNEQKTAKIIHLLEELRRDTPQARDRVDPEADAMATAADPHAVLDAINDRHETAASATRP